MVKHSMLLPIFVALCLSLLCCPPEGSAGKVHAGYRGYAVIRDDGNNLREFGGANYKQARVIYLLNQGDVVNVLGGQGKWSEIITADGVRGWVHNACLNPVGWRPGLQICRNDLPRRFPVDLDGDGHKESLFSLVDRPSMDGGEGVPELRDVSNFVLWRAHAVEGPLLFTCRDWGIYWPGAVGDLDGDGMVELIAQEPQSDVSPSSFFLARWNGNSFEPESNGWSLLEHPLGSGIFYREQYEYDGQPVTWIMDVQGVDSPGVARATIYSLGAEGNALAGVARVSMNEQGARILQWLEPLH